MLFGAAIYTTVQSLRTPDADNSDLESSQYNLQELLNPATFMAAYLEANCNADLLKNTQTIRISGTAQSNETSDNFVLLKMRPDRMLFTIDKGAYQVTFGVHGKKVWRRVRAPKQEDSFITIEGDEVQSWQSQARFYDRIIEAHLGNGSITAIETAKWDEIDSLRLLITDADEKLTEIYINPLTMHPIVERQSLDDGSMQQTAFFDYRDVDGMPIPFKITTTVDGNPTTRIQIESASLNTGIMSRLFEVPDELL